MSVNSKILTTPDEILFVCGLSEAKKPIGKINQAVKNTIEKEEKKIMHTGSVILKKGTDITKSAYGWGKKTLIITLIAIAVISASLLAVYGGLPIILAAIFGLFCCLPGIFVAARLGTLVDATVRAIKEKELTKEVAELTNRRKQIQQFKTELENYFNDGVFKPRDKIKGSVEKFVENLLETESFKTLVDSITTENDSAKNIIKLMELKAQIEEAKRKDDNT